MNVSVVWQEWLLDWYERQKRDLPWRRENDPYKIWVSEVMLQQTRVEAAIPYFERFLSQFPTLKDLAKAPEEAVLKAWEGLGYYSRARHLHAAVKEVEEAYGGRVPATYEQFRELPGVGDYTAGAVLSIGYGVPVPAVDGNVLRVLARFWGVKENILSSRTQKLLREQVAANLPSENPAAFNQALMELGALICKPRQPLCGECPLQYLCVANRLDLQQELPIRQKKVSTRIEQRVVLLVKAGDTWLVRQRPQKGLLAGLWELPHVHVPEKSAEAQMQRVAEQWLTESRIPLRDVLVANGTYTHVFSHLTWELTVFSGEANAADVTMPLRWTDREISKSMPYGQVFLRILKDNIKG